MNKDQKERKDRNNFRNAPRCGNCEYMVVAKNGTVLHCSRLVVPVNAQKICDGHKMRVTETLS